MHRARVQGEPVHATVVTQAVRRLLPTGKKTGQSCVGTLKHPPKKKKAHTSSLAGSSTRRRLTGIVAAAAAIVPGEFATAAMEPSNAPSNIINMSLTGMSPWFIERANVREAGTVVCSGCARRLAIFLLQ